MPGNVYDAWVEKRPFSITITALLTLGEFENAADMALKSSVFNSHEPVYQINDFPFEIPSEIVFPQLSIPDFL